MVGQHLSIANTSINKEKFQMFDWSVILKLFLIWILYMFEMMSLFLALRIPLISWQDGQVDLQILEYCIVLNKYVLRHYVKSVQIRSFFRSLFPYIWTECGEIPSISPCLFRIRENTDQKKTRIWTLLTQWDFLQRIGLQTFASCSFKNFIIWKHKNG